jgi:predicted permease
MPDLRQDLALAFRGMRRRPGFAAAAVATLAVGIGATAAMFSIVNAVLLRPLPFPDADAVVRLEERHGAGRRANLTGATFHDVRAESRSFTGVAAFRTFALNLSGRAAPEPVTAARVTGDFFDVLRARALHGRVLAPGEFGPAPAAVAVFSEALWRRWAGGDAAVVGSVVRLNGSPHVVVGVLPDRLAFPAGVDLWLPMGTQASLPANRRSHLFTVLARVRPGVTPAGATAELGALAARLPLPPEESGVTFDATPLGERITEAVRPALWSLFAAVGLLLAVACANVAGLLLARGAEREREMAIRGALGARGARLVRHMLVESVALGAAGAVAGAALAWGIARALPAIAPAGLPRLDTVRVDLATLAFTAAAALGTAALAALWPALRAARSDPRGLLGHAVAGAHRGRLRGGFVVAEVAVLVVLLGAASLLARSFVALQAVPLGLATERVLTFAVAPGGDAYRSPGALGRFASDVLAALSRAPGVEAAAVMNAVPAGPLPSTDFSVEGRDPASGDPGADVLAVSAGYFRMFGVRVLRGRAIAEEDAAGAPVVAVLSRTAAETFLPGQDPVGRRITLRNWDAPLEATVVGVVSDVRHRGPEADWEPAVYYSHAQFADRVPGWTFAIRTSGDPYGGVGIARDAVRLADPDQPLARVQSLEDVLAAAMATRRFNALLLSSFAAVSVLLVVVGLYGLLSRHVADRRREIGVRLAVGASPGHVWRGVFGHGLRLTALGLALGLPAALGAGRAMAGLLFGVAPVDPPTLAGVSTMVALVGGVAALLPARRAASVDPASALRDE